MFSRGAVVIAMAGWRRPGNSKPGQLADINAIGSGMLCCYCFDRAMAYALLSLGGFNMVTTV